MSLTVEDLSAIEAIVRGALKPTAVVPITQWLPRRLSLPEFAACLEVTCECARRYLRANKHGIVKNKIAVRAGGWKIDVAALPLFGVTQALGAARLAAWREAQAASPTPGQSAQPRPA